MGIITINIDFEKLWGEPEPTVSFDNSAYELTTEEGSEAALKFSVLNGDNEDVTDDCEISLNNSDISVEQREDGFYFVVAADKEVGEYTTAATATYAYKSAVVKAYAVINTVVETADPTTKYLTFKALESGTFSVNVPTGVSSNVTSVSYSVDNGATWTECVPSATAYTTPTVQAGSKVLWKGIATALANSNASTTFSSTGRFDVSGNIMSLLYGDDFADKKSLSELYALKEVFKNATHLVNGANLVLPATTLKNYCYNSMFMGCTSLTAAPALPARSLGHNCYQNMFQGCSSLTAAPALPATSIGQQCYSYMFNGCTSLTSAPALPTTSLRWANACYRGMFKGCTSLASAPALPATELGEQCYYQMFSGCTSLTTAPVLPATAMNNSCYCSMFEGCTSLTTAPALPATSLYSDCYNKMFSGCTSLTTAPVLPATSLYSGCYNKMFSGCTSLTTAPVLPATSLYSGCYSAMFMNCTSLTTAPVLPATTLAGTCYSSMFSGCTSLNYIKAMFTTTPSTSFTQNWVNGVAATGTFVKSAAATWDVSGTNGVPQGWTVQTA